MKYMLRKATNEDCDLLFDWANDPVVRAAAFHTEPIPYKSHIVWFRNMMNNPDIYQYILCEYQEMTPVAQIRLAVKEGVALISYSVGKDFRGHGVGTTLIEFAEKALLAEPIQIERFVAQVKYENAASARIFEKCGYDLEEKEDYKEFTKAVFNLWIRADGNPTIGLGHVMRCLSIADAASKQGFRVSFFTADGNVADLILQRGYTAYILNTDYHDMEAELPILTNIWKNQMNTENTVCLVDSYQVTEAYLKKVREYVKVAVMDDLFAMDYPADCVINYNIYGDLLKEKLAEQSGRKLLTGVAYAPLREQFLQERIQQNTTTAKTEVSSDNGEKNTIVETAFTEENPKHILISTGGSDSLHLAEKIAYYLLNASSGQHSEEYCQEKAFKTETCELQDAVLDIVCGAMNPNKEALLQIEAEHPEQVKVHIDVKDMAGLMSKCTVAVTAAGSTVYELSTLGVPFVLYYYVENQRLIAEHATEILGVVNCGDFSKDEAAAMKEILKETNRLLQDEAYRNTLSQHLRQTIDGKGAERIARELKKLRKTE